MYLLINVLWGRMVAKAISFCSKRFHCCFRNTPSGLAYRTKPQSCIKSGAEKDFDLLSQLVYHLDYTGGEEEEKNLNHNVTHRAISCDYLIEDALKGNGWEINIYKVLGGLNSWPFLIILKWLKSCGQEKNWPPR